MEEKRIEKLKQFLNIMNDSLTKDDFVKSFETVVKLIQELKKGNEKEFDLIHKSFSLLSEKLKNDTETDIGEAKNQMNQAVCDYCDKMDAKHVETMRKIDAKLLEVKDGEAVLAQIPPVKELAPETPISVRDKLETLDGDERLDKSAIKGLREEIDELKKMIGTKSNSGGGGFRKIRHFSETPEGTIDGLNTIFTLTTAPDPEDMLLVLNGVAQRNNSSYEYVLSGKTITYNSAPSAGSQHFCWFSKI